MILGDTEQYVKTVVDRTMLDAILYTMQMYHNTNGNTRKQYLSIYAKNKPPILKEHTDAAIVKIVNDLYRLTHTSRWTSLKFWFYTVTKQKTKLLDFQTKVLYSNTTLHNSESTRNQACASTSTSMKNS
jgi:hypothetical protein